jgi:hypothetical protein
MSAVYANAEFETDIHAAAADQRRDVEEAVSGLAGSAALLVIECAAFAIGLAVLGFLTTLT